MIVSRSVLKQIRSKGAGDSKCRQGYLRSTNKKSLRQLQQIQRNPLGDISSSGMFRNSGVFNNDKDISCMKKPSRQDEKRKATQLNQKPFILTSQNITPQMNLSHKNIKQLKFDQSNQLCLRQIRQLNLSHNQIRQILPTILVPFQFLQYLDLSNNKLQKISFPYNKMSLKQLKISQNRLTNLNLQHLKCLQNIDASNNKLIFITLPQSIKNINLNHNMLANTYFIEKCNKVQNLSMNFNFIYDLNFNSLSELDGKIIKKTQKSRFNCLKTVECSNNKICHLNGFQNLGALQILVMENNQLPLSRENVNQLLLLQSLKNLNIQGNSEEGVYSYQEFQSILFDKLSNFNSLNSKQKNILLFNEQLFTQEENQNQYDQQDNFYLFQSQHRKQINNQSTIKQNQLSMEYSGQKPFRLFLDDQFSQKYNSSIKKPQQTYERIYTLGDMDDKVQQQNDDKIFKKMTVQNRNEVKILQSDYKSSQFQVMNPFNSNISHQKVTLFQKSNKKIQQLQKQLSKSSSRILIPFQDKKKVSQVNFQITLQTRNLLKMIYQMSFIPPQPLKYSSDSLLISKRLDEDQDEYYLFTKLFEKKKGILYLKKIFLLQQNDAIFQNDDLQTRKQYELGFFHAPNLEEIYKNMLKRDCLISDLLDNKMQSNLINYLSPIPGAFGCHHIAVRHLNKKTSAFDKRNLTPVCYLIESKII